MKNAFKIEDINGILTVLYPLKETPVVDVRLVFRAGSYYEEGRCWGASHLMEHLTFQKTEFFANSLEMELFKEENGLSSNAFTSGERLSFVVSGPATSLKQMMFLVNQQAFAPVFEESNFAREVAVINQEYRDKWDHPNNRFGLAMDKQMFGEGHIYTRDGLGQVEYIEKLTGEDMRRWQRRMVVAENAVMAVTGRFELETVRKIIMAQLKPLRGERQEVKLGKIKVGNRELIYGDDVQQDRVTIYWPTPGMDDLSMKEKYKLVIARYLIGGSGRSVLYQELRQKRGLAYRVGAYRDAWPHAGRFGVWSSNHPEKTGEIKKLMGELVYEFIERPIDKEAYRRALGFLKSDISLRFDTVYAVSDNLLSDMFRYGKIYTPEEDIKVVEKIKEGEVREFLRTYLSPQNQFGAVMTGRQPGAGATL